MARHRRTVIVLALLTVPAVIIGLIAGVLMSKPLSKPSQATTTEVTHFLNITSDLVVCRLINNESKLSRILLQPEQLSKLLSLITSKLYYLRGICTEDYVENWLEKCNYLDLNFDKPLDLMVTSCDLQERCRVVEVENVIRLVLRLDTGHLCILTNRVLDGVRIGPLYKMPKERLEKILLFLEEVFGD